MHVNYFLYPLQAVMSSETKDHSVQSLDCLVSELDWNILELSETCLLAGRYTCHLNSDVLPSSKTVQCLLLHRHLQTHKCLV